MDSATGDLEVSLPLKIFLTMPECPPDWRRFDLYQIEEPPVGSFAGLNTVVIYVGKSYCAFERVWEHIHGGPHGYALVGRLALVNWPRSGRWTVRLLSSQSPRFASVGNDVDAAEQMLIEEHSPCLNVALNRTPTPLPEGCLPPNAPYRGVKSYKRMIREAGYLRRSGPGDDQRPE